MKISEVRAYSAALVAGVYFYLVAPAPVVVAAGRFPQGLDKVGLR